MGAYTFGVIFLALGRGMYCVLLRKSNRYGFDNLVDFILLLERGLLLFKKEKSRIKMEMGSCQCHCMGTADAVFYYRLYDLSWSFFEKVVIFIIKSSHI